MFKKHFYIDSHQRVSGTHSNFLYKIDLSSIHNSKNLSVAVLSAVIPKSYYLIVSPNNTFQLREGATTATITITPGNYNVSTFRTLLTTLLNNASPTGWTYTITFDRSTGKYTYTPSVGPASFIIPAATNNGSGLHEQLGFDPSTTVTVPATSTNVCKFVAQDSLLIRSDICTDATGVLQDVVTSGSTDFSSITYRCPEIRAYSKPLATKNSGVFRFTITDPDGNIIDTNGLPCSITLVIYRDPMDAIMSLIGDYLSG